MPNEAIKTTCCIVGGGPAGMMLGYLLARAGVDVTVLEKHKDFFRDFRGDTVHPSTLQVIYELGLLDEFLKLPHQQLTRLGGVLGGYSFEAADFRRLPTRCKFVALMPQWDFLDFFAEKAGQFPNFKLRMEHEAVDLLEYEGRVVGVQATQPGWPIDIHADLVVGCDGRHSTTRNSAHFEVIESGVPIDVLWFRIGRSGNDPEQLLGNFNYGSALILIPRGDYFQAGLLIRKGSFEQIQGAGIPAFREHVGRIAPHLRDLLDQITDWEQIKLLSIQINRLKRWHRPGLLCIGDAAHAMSPAGGVGINLAIQDAVATANLLTNPLLHGEVTEADLWRVQLRREFPTRVTQAVQAFAHNQMAKLFENQGPARAPWQLKAVFQMPGVSRTIARAVGMGARPEHIGVAQPPCSGVSMKKVAIGVGLLAAGSILAMRWFTRARRTA